MKCYGATLLLVGFAAAHSQVLSITFDGTNYPARSALDASIGVNRIEWKSASPFTFMPISNLKDPALTCQTKATPPEIKAYARAGSSINIRWTSVVSGHVGPVMSYLGRWQPGQTPQQVKFFKIDEKGYDPKTGMWGNQVLVRHNHTDTIQIPSDIQPGTYIFRTELLALHGTLPALQYTTAGGPQFYPHCFNVEISGSGAANPPGVYIPGVYSLAESGMKLVATSTKYVVPGPALYQGKYDAPSGPAPAVKATGAFPDSMQKKYKELSVKFDGIVSALIDSINRIDFVNSKEKVPSLADVFGNIGKMTSGIVGLGTLPGDIASFKKELKVAQAMEGRSSVLLRKCSKGETVN